MATPPRVITIAGSDSGGGAGVQADLRTFALLRCHGSSAITALTAQNSLGVQSVYPVPPEAVEAQIRSVLSDIGADAGKTGMLFSAEVIGAVSRALGSHPVEKLVVDPVMVAKGGAPLLRDDAREALVRRALPLALIVTPNLPEAEVLARVSIRSADDRREACRRILGLGPKAVLLKGGHGTGEWVEDCYADASGTWRVFRSRRIETRHTHGTGCTLSAAVAAHLAAGLPLLEAVERSREFLQIAIREGYPLGAGHGPTNPYAAARLGGHNEVLERLRAGWDLLEAENPIALIPQVQSNLAEALPGARGIGDVAAFPGRLLRCGERVRRVDGPRFGASRHLARVLLASARAESPHRSVMNVRCGAGVLEACRAAGLWVEGFSWGDEPRAAKEAGPAGPEWGTAHVLERCGRAPDVIHDGGGSGKEPMVRVFGADAVEVAQRVVAVNRALTV